MVRRAVDLKRVYADLLASMHIPSGLGPERFDMAAVAGRFPAEEFFITALGWFGFEILARFRFRCGQRELIKVQRWQLARDQILVRINVREITESIRRRY